MSSSAPWLDLRNIQGNILRGYRGYRYARFLFFAVDAPSAGQGFLSSVVAFGVTPAEWDRRRAHTTNVAVSYRGLRALGVPEESADSFPPEFREGMRGRADVLGDTGANAPSQWDKPWRGRDVHILLMCYAQRQDMLQKRCDEILDSCPQGVESLPPHQAAAQILVDGYPVEHFGFVDGLSNPAVEGAPKGNESNRLGNPTPGGGFRDVPAGEFIFGYPAIGGQEPSAPVPRLLVRDGTFLVVRKLAQDVAGFRRYVGRQADMLNQLYPGCHEDFLAAKLVGRWRDGSPLVLHPMRPGSGDPENQFDYVADPDGARCPLGAHIRRSNPRSGLGLGGELSKRRRFIRRGIPYGTFVPENETPDDTPRGLMFLAFMTSIGRQFEFVQQQWIEHGDDFGQGNDKDVIAGNNDGSGRMVVPGDDLVGRPPFLLTGLPRFVTVKGGEYFFVPSMSALRLLADGRVEVD